MIRIAWQRAYEDVDCPGDQTLPSRAGSKMKISILQAVGAFLGVSSVSAIQLDPTSRGKSSSFSAPGLKSNAYTPDSIVSAVNTVTKNALAFYVGDKPGQTPGIPVPPYYW